MAEFGGFFNSVNGDRKYKSEDLAKYLRTFMSTGVNPAIDNLRVYKKNNKALLILLTPEPYTIIIINNIGNTLSKKT